MIVKIQYIIRIGQNYYSVEQRGRYWFYQLIEVKRQ